MVKYSFFMHHLSGKYRALFVFAIFILLVLVLITLFFFFWQWLLYYQDKRIFRWVGNQKLYQLLEPCHVPFCYFHSLGAGAIYTVLFSGSGFFTIKTNGYSGGSEIRNYISYWNPVMFLMSLNIATGLAYCSLLT